MKHCPKCGETFDEEIIRFCTKDGTPLIEAEEPKFTAMPSENIEPPDDDLGEETVIRRRPATAEPEQPERIVIPTSGTDREPVRARTIPPYYPPPQPPNTLKTVVLTIIGTVALLACGAGLFWLLQKDTPANNNLTINTNMPNLNSNLNANSGFDSNFNFNTNANYSSNYNFNLNTNFNTRTPSPTPSPTPKLSPTPPASPTPATSPTPGTTPRPPANVRPTNSNAAPAGTPRTGPRPPTANRPPAND